LRPIELTPTLDVVTLMCSDVVWPLVSATVALHEPTASPVTVRDSVGPFPVVGFSVAMFAHAVAPIVKVPE
jgi:hypothetical protein